MDPDCGDDHAGEEEPRLNCDECATAALWRHLRPSLARKFSPGPQDSPVAVCLFRASPQIMTLIWACQDRQTSPLESAAGKGVSAKLFIF